MIPQALQGQLPQAIEEPFEGRRRDRKYNKEPRLEHAFKNVFMGIAFLFVAMALSFSMMGRGWWFWMLIPAFSIIFTCIAQ